MQQAIRPALTFRLSRRGILAAETVTVRSGNGSIGGIDSAVHFLSGPAASGFNRTFTATDFAAAQNGPAAYILSQISFWIPGLPSDPLAHWIGTNPNAGSTAGNTALYAVSFQITSASPSGTMTLNYSVDDGVGSGDPLNTGSI